ncbi:MAG: hypothetical protein HY300_02035 [Verrucomicrobia bacterium]|nr:hypothetical protein [Verrucomicrobiota bacterium]
MASGRQSFDWREWMRRDRVTFALALSLLLHASLYGGYVLGRKLGIVDLPLPKWVRQLTEMKFLLPKPLDPEKLKKLLEKQRPPDPEREVRLTFVDTDPRNAVTDPPPNAKFMSSQSTRAANPKPSDKNDPKIEGKQTQIIKVVEASKPQVASTTKPPEEAAPQKPPQPEPKPVTKPAEKMQVAEFKPAPKPVPAPGDLTPMKPQPEQKPVATKGTGPQDLQPTPPPEPVPERARTLAQVRAQKEAGLAIAGQKMQQSGGVRRVAPESLDAQGSLFGAYDAALIAAVQQRWWNLLADRPSPRGKVVVSFRLHSDGRVSDLKMGPNDVGEFFGYFCMAAIKDPSPFAKWPADMRRQMDADFRDVKFTFYYN